MKTSHQNLKAALATAALLSLAVLAPSAHADDASVGVGRRAVSYADLNLGTAEGAKVLYQRIRNAAVQVCGDVGSRQMEIAAAAQACVDHAILSSVRAVNNPQFTRTAATHGYEVEPRFNLASAR